MLNDNLLTAKQISQAVNKSKATIYRWVNAGKFPKPIKINNSTLWRASEVNAWLANPTAQGGDA